MSDFLPANWPEFVCFVESPGDFSDSGEFFMHMAGEVGGLSDCTRCRHRLLDSWKFAAVLLLRYDLQGTEASDAPNGSLRRSSAPEPIRSTDTLGFAKTVPG